MAFLNEILLPKTWDALFIVALARDRRHRGSNAHAIGFRFQRMILDHGDAAAEWIPDTSRSLLHDVPELVTEQLLSLNCVWIVLARSEVNVRAPRVSDRAERR